MLNVQSFGAGVQSTALLHLALDGKIPKPDLVIFADTQAEPAHVYEVVKREQQNCLDAEIEFVIVSNGDLSEPSSYLTTKGMPRVYVPLFVRGNDHPEKVSMLMRSCTENFKIRPIRRYLRKQGYTRQTEIKLWLGISMDEIIRMKPSPVQWIEHVWPLIDLKMTRQECLDYLSNKGIQAAKSACVFCPYRNYETWDHIRQNPGDWKAAVEYDEKIRNILPHVGQSFVHRSGLPLTEAPIEKPKKESKQIEISFDDECTGHCGL